MSMPSERGWWSRNWKWVVPVGCLAPLVVCCGGIGMLVTFVFGAIKSSEPYREAVARGQASPSLQADEHPRRSQDEIPLPVDRRLLREDERPARRLARRHGQYQPAVAVHSRRVSAWLLPGQRRAAGRTTRTFRRRRATGGEDWL